jgi:hypothetical protein
MPVSVSRPGQPERRKGVLSKGRESMSPHNNDPGRGQRSRFLARLIVVMLLGGISALLGSWNGVSASFPAMATPIVSVPTRVPLLIGYAAFESSGLVDAQMTQGINDEVQLDLYQVPTPDPGTRYWAWLLPDKELLQAILLGQLTIEHAAIHFHYAGDQQHTDLLATTSRLLVTEEDAVHPPRIPSMDEHRWRYYGAIPHDPNPTNSMDHASLLDHIRSLVSGPPLVSDSGTLMPVQGGLSSWLVFATRNVLEWASAARGGLGTPEAPLFLRIDLYRILDELDGSALVQQDVPAGTPLYVDPQLSQVPLLQLEPGQMPAASLSQIALHLAALARSAEATPEQRALASRLLPDLTQVADSLERVRDIARHLVLLSDAQLALPATVSLLDDLVEQANRAYAGTLNPATGEREGGALRIADQLERLATIVVQPCNQCRI